MIRQAVVLPATDSGSSRVAGLPLLKRAILALGRGGIERVYVVVTSSAAAAGIANDPDVSRAGVVVEVIESTILSSIRGRVDGAFVLASGDRVFDVAIVRAACSAQLAEADLVLCVGRRTEPELERATKVRLEGDQVVEIGSSVTDVAAIDTGVAAAGPGLLAALAPDDGSFTAAITRLVARRRVRAIDIGDAFWHVADSKAARAHAEDALFRALRKRTDGPVSRWLNRPMSLFVTRRLVNTNITPNQMTIVANLIGAVGVVLVFQGTWSTLGIGALLVHLQSILDGCDGELARLKFKSSRIGEWLDNVLDDQVNIGYGIALGFAATAVTGQGLWQWIGLGSGIAFFLHNLAFYAQLAFVHRSGNPFLFRWWFENGNVDVTAMVSQGGLGMQLGGAARSLIRRDLFLFAFLVLAVVRLPQVAVVWYAAIAASQFVLMAIHLMSGGAPASSRRLI